MLCVERIWPTLKRFCFYALSFIGLLLLMEGIFELCSAAFGPQLIGETGFLISEALLRILIGFIIFSWTWIAIQKKVASSEEERISKLRVIFFGLVYAVIISAICVSVFSMVQYLLTYHFSAHYPDNFLQSILPFEAAQTFWEHAFILVICMLTGIYFSKDLWHEWRLTESNLILDSKMTLLETILLSYFLAVPVLFIFGVQSSLLTWMYWLPGLFWLLISFVALKLKLIRPEPPIREWKIKERIAWGAICMIYILTTSVFISHGNFHVIAVWVPVYTVNCLAS